jgi:hypothetical protein
MASVTTWTRLEPTPRQASLETSLQARIHDPLWMLARQWQLGEFQGEDSGSPVTVSVTGERAQLTRFQPGAPPRGAVQGQAFDPARVPLESVVERERATPRPDVIERLHVAAEAGQQFLRMLAREPFGTRYHAGFVAQFPLPRPTADQVAAAGTQGLRFLSVLAGRVPSGALLAAALRQPALPAAVPIDGADQPAVRRVADAFLRWYDTLFSEPPADTSGAASWSSRRMEYAFAVAAPAPGPSLTPVSRETVLVARQYSNGHLDWLDFDLAPGAALGAAADRSAGGNPLAIAQTVLPSPVTFRGMPAPRWWEFEDAAVDFGAVEPDPDDLARMLMLEFALTYGNDWFVVPLDVPVGALCLVDSVVVTDTFGVRTRIPPITGSTHPTAASWRMFRHSVDRASGPTIGTAAGPPSYFFLAPALARTLDGQPLDDILLLRDEMANVAWGVEGVVEGPSGRALDRRQVHAERPPAPAPPPSRAGQDALVWRLATEVPEYWIPLIPVQVDAASGAIAFRRGATLRPDGSRNVDAAQSAVLRPDPRDTLDIHEEEIPREGARITRAFQYARWIDGAPLLWLGRRKLPGRGEGSSGLRFDTAARPDAGASS